MLTRLLVYLCGISPIFRRAAWRWWYSKLAREIRAGSWTFMNYGFVPTRAEEEKSVPALRPEDEADRLCIQLYERVTSPVPLAGKTVLEVGCGRGGGSSYLARYRGAEQVRGMDYSPDAIAFCKDRHKAVANLQFVVGDAEQIPFPDSSWDVVVNVESSHCYGDIPRFLTEVVRVLRTGGHFVYADLRAAKEMDELKTMLAAQTAWTRIEEEDITAAVAAALESDDKRKRSMICELVSPRLQPMFEEFAGVEGGQVSQGLRKRDLLYFRFVFRRK